RLYCFRGGQRSSIACEWVKAEGINVERIEGGYKRMRNYLIASFDELPPLTLLSGQTGSGKTSLLRQIDPTVDLEALANHRGSAFGGTIQPQPSQIDFENAVAIAFLKLGTANEVVLEDEGRLIGRVHLPLPLQHEMKSAPIVVVKANVDERTENIFTEYVVEQWQLYQDTFGATAHEEFAAYLLGALDSVRKRLGGVNHRDIRAAMESALSAQERTEDLTLHRSWIRSMLTAYYDPMYNYQLSQKTSRIVFEGTVEDVTAWYKQHGFAA
ncbi:MAG: tRNA 2-selenouridine(34) synthase MnmH, partial [Proteobacteria bacterium]|nr:tRNA 2-selenouridine(34) synthase MnmH [Pseudomonadota bacterium]